MLHDRRKEVVLIELTHTDRGILLRNNERYVAKDVLGSGDLSHVKYLVAGPGTCSLARLESGEFVSALREKGVGVINTSYREVSSEIALKRLQQMILIFKDVEQYNIPAYYLLDVVDQTLGISGQETTNITRLNLHEGNPFG